MVCTVYLYSLCTEFLDSQGKTMKIYEMISQEVGSDMMIALLAMMSDSNSDTLHYRVCFTCINMIIYSCVHWYFDYSESRLPLFC